MQCIGKCKSINFTVNDVAAQLLIVQQVDKLEIKHQGKYCTFTRIVLPYHISTRSFFFLSSSVSERISCYIWNQGTNITQFFFFFRYSLR